ncbi:elongation factor G-like protein EF-G2 [Microlunatus sp. Gsoil 973]|uniref:elongation factor G-like protein EF-G2 n=1 Tax=Microlunatus sp. Gsoil 973 TaxID=2672569 RepID=UPI0012B47166|nr:elongation factor G-like protein EF-G2 [Microlunatus sp. Gsoil 973]QGN34310.1 elongation factor G-like protein EF-G2 [Microlunatus sp. Gsoil 973]
MALKAEATTGRKGRSSTLAAVDPAGVRNVALVGPSGSGKTTLVEALLARAGVITRSGTIPDGNTVCDHDPAAIRQHRSVSLAVAPLVHNDVKINLVDTPGYADFVGELRAGLRAADAALFVISASEVSGQHGGEGAIDPATIAEWEECAAVGMPRAVVVTRCDHPRADLEATIAVCQQVFGDGVAPLYLPIRDNGTLTDLYGLLSRTPSDGAPQNADESRATLIEGIIEQSEDETLMDRYLDGEDVDVSTLIKDLETAVTRGSFYPVIPVCATEGIGLDAILELLVGGFPSPLEHPLPPVSMIDGSDHPELTSDPGGPLAAEVVHTSADAYVGRVSLVRVFSGTLRPDTSVHICGHHPARADAPAEDGQPADEIGHDDDDRVAHIYSPLGVTLREVDFAVAGDICALTKLASAETGDTISAVDHPLLLEAWELPEPQLPVAVVPHARADEDALVRNLARLVAADPTLRLERNPETHQIVLWCMGEAHADLLLSRLRSGGAEIDTEPVRVPLRETMARPVTVTGRHVKQSGGHGQYAICQVQFEPLPRGAGFEFVSKVVGGAVPRQYVASVEKGIREAMERGVSEARNPLIDIRATLVDGKAHSVDSSDAAFQSAGALAMREAAAAAGTVVLEPLDEVAVRIPDQYLGAVLADLSGRRGRVLGTEIAAPGRTVIRAEVPQSELLRYATDLRATTAGAATFTRSFARYDASTA